MQLAMGNILATICMPVGIKTMLLIKYLRRNLVPLLHWPYTAQGSETCYPQEVYTCVCNMMNRRYKVHPVYPTWFLLATPSASAKL